MTFIFYSSFGFLPKNSIKKYREKHKKYFKKPLDFLKKSFAFFCCFCDNNSVG